MKWVVLSSFLAIYFWFDWQNTFLDRLILGFRSANLVECSALPVINNEPSHNDLTKSKTYNIIFESIVQFEHNITSWLFQDSLPLTFFQYWVKQQPLSHVRFLSVYVRTRYLYLKIRLIYKSKLYMYFRIDLNYISYSIKFSLH